MGNPFQRVWFFIKTSLSSKIIGILALLIIVAAVPLTVFISQQRQETRQHAAGTTVLGRIQGFRRLNPGTQNISPAIDQIVTLDGIANSTDPVGDHRYVFGNLDITNGGLHTVSVTDIPGYTTSFSLCYNRINCHNPLDPNPAVPPYVAPDPSIGEALGVGNSITIDYSKINANPSDPTGQYADLWWHYTPIPSESPTSTLTPTGTQNTCQCDLSSVVSNNCTPPSVATCTGEFSCACVSPSLSPTCTPRPACLDANPPCKIPEPANECPPTCLPANTACGMSTSTIGVTPPSCCSGLVCAPSGTIGEQTCQQPTISPTCTPRPACLDANPPCKIPEPANECPPTDIILKASFHLQSVGINPNIRENHTPKHTTRSITIQVFDQSNNEVVKKADQQITYNSSTGNFDGTFNLGQISPGSYLVKGQTPKYLRKLIARIFTVTAGTTQYTIPDLQTLIVGDINTDNKIDPLDYNTYVGCFGNKANNTTTCPNKDAVDLNDDGLTDTITDNTDFAWLFNSFENKLGD